MYLYIYICIVKRIKWFSHILKQTETFATVHCSYHNGTQAKRMDSLVHLDNTKKKAALAGCMPVNICLITMYAIHYIHRSFVCVYIIAIADVSTWTVRNYSKHIQG